MKMEVKAFVHLCDAEGCGKEIEDYEEYKNVCFICHKDVCGEHRTLYVSDDSGDEFVICHECYNKLSEDFEKAISEN